MVTAHAWKLLRELTCACGQLELELLELELLELTTGIHAQ